MSRYRLPNGQVIQDDQPFELSVNITIPSQGMTDENGDFIELTPPRTVSQPMQFAGIRYLPADEVSGLGIVAVLEMARPDDRFYFVSDDPLNPGRYISTPKDLVALKASAVDGFKQTASGILSQSDWEITKAFEDGVAIDPALKAYRQSVRDYSNTLEATIATMDFNTFVAWCGSQQSWPVRATD
jgi:hypothetical protein